MLNAPPTGATVTHTARSGLPRWVIRVSAGWSPLGEAMAEAKGEHHQHLNMLGRLDQGEQ
jgi:hypothetical protein